MSAVFNPSRSYPTFTSTLTLTAAPDMGPGTWTITVRAQAGRLSRSAQLQVTVEAAQSGSSGKLAVVYYGWLIGDASGSPSQDAYRIAAKHPDILIAAPFTLEPRYVNLSPQVLSLMKNAGTLVLAYVHTDYGNRPLEDVKKDIADALSLGVDGLFVDEAYNFLDDSKLSYYSQIYEFVKSYGDKLVVLNTGVWQSGESVMTVSDVLSVEHQWLDFATKNTWRSKYPGTRFMGLSEGVTGPEEAVSLTRQSWELGVLNHYSTYRYTELEGWWEEYAAGLGY